MLKAARPREKKSQSGYFENHFEIFSSIMSRGTVKRSRDTRKMVSRSDSFPVVSIGGRVAAENGLDVFPSMRSRR